MSQLEGGNAIDLDFRAGHHLAFRRVTVAYDALVAVRGLQIGMLAEKVRDLGLDRVGQQTMRPVAQDFGELIVDVSWLNQFDDVILDTAYRSFGGEVNASSTPTICRLSDSRRHQLSAIAPEEPSTASDVDERDACCCRRQELSQGTGRASLGTG